jgi:E3 ubiquitin-protein ligase MARCH6
MDFPLVLLRRPLYHPCICSGSIGLTHQDCLQSWLQVQRGDGSCELCKTKFRFAPKYAPNAPAKLSTHAIITGILRRTIAKWLPFTIRSLFAASLWLIVAPLLTAYLYHGWMARPSIVLDRMRSRNTIVTDLISGGVVACCIIISFLSLMSFADFLRLELQQRAGGMGAHNNRIQNRRRDAVAALAAGEIEVHDDSDDMNVDNGIMDEIQKYRLNRRANGREISVRLRPLMGQGKREDKLIDQNNSVVTCPEIGELQVIHGLFVDDDDEEDKDDEDYEESDDIDDIDSWESTIYGDDEDDGHLSLSDEELDHAQNIAANINEMDPLYFHPNQDNDVDIDEGNDLQNRQEDELRIPPRGRPRPGQPNDGFGALDQEEPIDMDINIALDELLGIRGPLMVVARNLLWLLAFNAVYLGFFAFVPRTIGIAMSSIMFQNTGVVTAAANTSSENATEIVTMFNSTEGNSIVTIWRSIEAESIKHETAFRLHDIAMVALGYFSLAVAIVAFRYIWLLSIKIRSLQSGANQQENQPDAYNLREAFDEMNRIVRGFGNDEPPIGEQADVAVGLAIGVAIDVTVAIVKVGVLLFLKMFLLPIVLGIALDASSIGLFHSTLEDRVTFAGRDIFSFILLHWVAGITFMLLVTVSVLQLREVAHPDLLSQMIRPQEPQPDLLGNLMNESVSTHSKRMVLSLIIYVFLLLIHIYLPVRYGLSLFIGERMKTQLELKFNYILPPQLQVPLELLFFHLCMLALLEKYKNGLGGMQHQWLNFMTRIMGLSDCILPHTIASFRLVGSRPVFNENRKVDSFWYDLVDKNKDTIANLSSKFNAHDEVIIARGYTKANGVRVVLLGADYIRLPSPQNSLHDPPVLLPSKFGRYRLKRDESARFIELWEEVAGLPILRPPEGWDDLGVGGADVQGRWAWSSEKKSKIENGVASRRLFFGKKQSFAQNVTVLLKLLVLGCLSWLAASTLLVVVSGTPMFIGRALFIILRIPSKWIHDPFAFFLGFTIMFPFIRKTAKLIVSSDLTIQSRLKAWIGRFHAPPIHKALILFATVTCWFGIAPLLLGLSYDIAFLKSIDWFDGKEPFYDLNSTYWSWMEGTVLLYIWADLCILGVLTRNYRVFVLDVQRQANDNDDTEEIHEGNTLGRGLSWQGKHGRIARFWGVLKSIVQGWEWDQIDEVLLLHECAAPIVIELLYVLTIPILAYGFCFFRFPHLSGFSRACLVRVCLALSCCLQVSRVWKDQLRSFFNLAHQTVRDDLYLIGEILLNHGES